MFDVLANVVTSKLPPRATGWLYDNTPHSVVRRYQLSAFRRTVRHAARHSQFYRRRFQELGIDARGVRTPADLGNFFTTPDDLAQHAEEFIATPPSIVFESSGTSGRNKRVYFDEREMRHMGVIMAGGLGKMGVTRDDRIANAFDFSIWIPGLLSHYGLVAAGNFCQAFGKVDPIEVYRRLDTYKHNVILGEPTWLIRLTELAERHGSRPLKLMIGGAEEMPAGAIPWMRDVWQGVTVKMCYGSVEQGTSIAFQPCAEPARYHLDDLNFLPELVEQDDDGYGELIFTTLTRHVMPLIRYRTRDVTKVIDHCACGRRAAAMTRLRGRRDELIVASGGNLYPKMFEDILTPVEGLTRDFQVTFDLEGLREVMTIHVESRRTDLEALESDIMHQATEQYPDLMKNLALGIFQMRVAIEAPGSLRSGRKLKRVVDRRHFDADATAAPGGNGNDHVSVEIHSATRPRATASSSTAPAAKETQP